MGKCKKRNLYRSNGSSISSDITFMTRETAVNNIFRMITENSSKKSTKKERTIFQKVLDTISLFGISAEELSEAGVPYENLRALGSTLN